MTINEFGKQPKRRLLQTLIPSLPASVFAELETHHNTFQREMTGPGAYAFLNINYNDGMLEIQAIHGDKNLKLVCKRESRDVAKGPPQYELSLLGVGDMDMRMLRPKISKLFYANPKEADDTRISPARIEAVISALSYMTECLLSGQMPDIENTKSAFSIDEDGLRATPAPQRRLRAGHLKHMLRHKGPRV